MIILKSETMVASQKDMEVFIEALINPPEPNDALLSAVGDFYSRITM